MFPFERQEPFFERHKRAFDFFDGIPHTVIWDNLTIGVKKILKGKSRAKHESFTVCRSHYVFDSRLTAPRKVLLWARILLASSGNPAYLR